MTQLGHMFLLLIVVGLGVVLISSSTPRENGEAKRGKYVFVWFLAVFITNIYANIVGLVWGTYFLGLPLLPLSVISPTVNFGLFFVAYLALFFGSCFIFIYIYNLFTNLDRRKVTPFIWLTAVLVSIFSIFRNTEDPSNLSDAELRIHALAIISSSLFWALVCIRWIKKNPGFEILTQTREQVNEPSNQPNLDFFWMGASRSPGFASKKTKNKVLRDEKDKFFANEKKENTFTSQEKIIQTKVQYSPPETNTEDAQQIEKSTEEKPNATEANTSESKDFLPKNLRITQKYIMPDNDALEELHCAVKFKDVSDIIHCLQDCGFEIQNKSFPIILKDQNNEETIFADNLKLINFTQNLIWEMNVFGKKED